jgi:hypothetical protein
VWTSLTRPQSGVCSVQPSGYRFLICDQKRLNPSLDRLKNAIPCSLAPFDRSVQRDAEISTRFDQFSVPGRDRRRSGLWPFCQPNLDVDAEALARLVERLVDTWAAAVNDDDITAEPRDQTLQYDQRQVVAAASSFAGE